MTPEFWRVFNYLAKHWYEDEYGVSESRWYLRGMCFMEHLAWEASRAAR